MTRRLLVLILLSASMSAPAAGVGSWELTGLNPDGTTYSARLALSEFRPGVLHLDWYFAGERLLYGYGIPFAGDLIGAVVTDGDQIVVEVLRVGDDGLAGIWSNGLAYGSETMGAPVPAPRPVEVGGNREYGVRRRRPGGEWLGGRVFIGAVPDAQPGIAAVSWDLLGEEGCQAGEGIRLGEALVVAFKLAGRPAVACYEATDYGWEGRFFAAGMEEPGEESLRRDEEAGQRRRQGLY